MEKIFIICALFISISTFASSEYECKTVKNNNLQKQVCFPIGHVCTDPHGIGDGVPIKTDCWTGGSRACANGSSNWPACAGGITTNTCKDVSIDGEKKSVCFPLGHICKDPHGIGDGVPIKTDCWTGGSRTCANGSPNWPTCAGGFIAN